MVAKSHLIREGGDPGIAPEAVELYRMRGWVQIPGVFRGQEIESLRNEADRLIGTADLFQLHRRGVIQNGTPRKDRLDPVIDLSPVFAELAHSRKLVALASAALGREARLFKDRFIAKPPGSPGYSAHQDGAYWQDFGVAPGSFVTVVICLDRADQLNGAIECTSGQHQCLLTQSGTIDDPREDQLAEFTYILAEPGDVLLLHSLTPHRSGPNRSATARRALFFVYAPGPADLYPAYLARRMEYL